MTDRPLVTIGCAVYNGEATLARALESVIAQDYPNLEILISDDCSTDRSPAICAEFAARDPRIRLLKNAQNIGLAANFSRLAREARGKYFMWADQDDLRAPTFVSKTAAALEANPEAILCHSHTGVFVGDPTDIKYVVTLYGYDGNSPRLQRYAGFLRYGNDTTLYGLIRTDALQKTRLFRPELSVANPLLYELILLGPFLQVPEALYFYSARGLRNRPSPQEEYARSNEGKRMPLLHYPFLVLAMTQTRDLGRAPIGWLERAGLASVLWTHTSAVAMTKLVYRSLAVPFGDRLPEAFTALCDDIVEAKAHLIFRQARDEALFPTRWHLTGGHPPKKVRR